MRITRKLGLLVGVSLIAVITFATFAVITSGGQVWQSEDLVKLVSTNTKAGDLVHALHSERSRGVVSLSYNSEHASADYADAVEATDQDFKVYRESIGELSALPSATQTLFSKIKKDFAAIDESRRQIREREQKTSEAGMSYRTVIYDLLSFRKSVSHATAVSSETGDRLESAAALSQAIESVGQQEVAVLRGIDAQPMSYALYDEIAGARTSYTGAIQDFNASAPRQWRHWLENAQNSEDAVGARDMQLDIARVVPGDELDINIDSLVQLMDSWVEQLNVALRHVDADIAADVTAQRDSKRLVTGAESVGVAAVVGLAIALALWLGKSVIFGLRRLRDAAHQVATKDLPEAVARLDNHEILGELTPEEFADGMPPPLTVEGKDELAEVGQAFNEVQREAVRVAAQQALLRLHIGAIFVNLARRGHALASRLTSSIDEAERHELDPERLERLFALDHLVTLLSRSNDSLLVLGGTSPAKVRVNDEPVRDVITAAQGQIEQYKRVQIAGSNSGIAVRASSVDAVVKLLAELLDNATRYSDSDVRVSVEPSGDSVTVQISDDGIGIADEQLAAYNVRLANRAALDLDAVRAMGLTVVGHIASRLGIAVQLSVIKPHGTIARVNLPSAILSRPTSDSGEPSAALPQKTAQPSAVPRLFQPSLGSSGQPGPRPEPSSESSLLRPKPKLDDTVMIPVMRFDFESTGDVPKTAEPQAEQHEVPQAELPAEPQGEAPVEPGSETEDSFEDGWQAAERAAQRGSELEVDGDLLPKRNPGHQLIPGGQPADSERRANPSNDYRDPAAVSATYSAYARGRSISSVSPLPTDQGHDRDQS